MFKIFCKPEPTVGLVIGTFAAVPYVHIALEAWRRNRIEIPVFVHDDNSAKKEALRVLCDAYGADFACNPRRGRWMVGDISTFADGLEWAREKRLDLLVKMSRRFIPLHNWVPGLQRLAYETQYATFSNQCLHFGFGFRTECIGLHVEAWHSTNALTEMRDLVTRNQGVFVEQYIHNLAREIHKHNCEANREFERNHPRPRDTDAYGIWDIMAERRTSPKPDVLWHNSDKPIDYCRIARVYGLNYQVDDFLDANQGEGPGEQ